MNFESILFGLLMLILGTAALIPLVGLWKLTRYVAKGEPVVNFARRHNKATFALCSDQFNIMLGACTDTHTRALLANGVLALRTMHQEGKSAEDMSFHTFNVAREFARSTLLTKKDRANDYSRNLG